MTKLVNQIPIAAVVLALIVVAMPLLRQADTGPYDLAQFGTLPASAGGRTKPMDSVARNSLIIISDKQTLILDNGEREPAIKWFLDVVTKRPGVNDEPAFRVVQPDVRSLLGNPPDKQKRVSFNQIAEHSDQVNSQMALMRDVPPKSRSLYQRRLVNLFNKAQLYFEITHSLSPYALPPISPGEQWRPLANELSDQPGHPEPTEAATMLSGIYAAYHAQDPGKFNSLVNEYTGLLDQTMPSVMRKARFEVFFNRLQPFYLGIMLYVFTFLLSAGALLAINLSKGVLARALSRAAVAVIALTFVLHTFGLIARVYLQGYAPVTNLYSSAVFIGWFCVVMGLFIEWLYNNGLGVAFAAVIGAATLIIAHNLAAGDTMQMMQAVLDSNFWLSTHVIAVTIGYSATFMAGLIGIVYILGGVFTPLLDSDTRKVVGKMLYGTIAFALLFSFVGTVLGGIWADQSWGRFWGWDPKENGAVLIVLMNALILHARWAGLVKMRGVAVLAVFGNIVTAWSWFGTNMLGVGLHSYGFMDRAVKVMIGFILLQLLIMAIGMLPTSWWMSHRIKPTPPTP